MLRDVLCPGAMLAQAELACILWQGTVPHVRPGRWRGCCLIKNSRILGDVTPCISLNNPLYLSKEDLEIASSYMLWERAVS